MARVRNCVIYIGYTRVAPPHKTHTHFLANLVVEETATGPGGRGIPSPHPTRPTKNCNSTDPEMHNPEATPLPLFDTQPDALDQQHYFNSTPTPQRALPQTIPYDNTITTPPTNYDAICPSCDRTITTFTHHQGASHRGCRYSYTCKNGSCKSRPRLTSIKSFRIKRSHRDATRETAVITHSNNSTNPKPGQGPKQTPSQQHQLRPQPQNHNTHGPGRQKKRASWVTNSDLVQFPTFKSNSQHPLPTLSPNTKRSCKNCGQAFPSRYQTCPPYSNGKWVCDNCGHNSAHYIVTSLTEPPISDHLRDRLQPKPPKAYGKDIFFMQTYCNNHVAQIISKDLNHRPAVTKAIASNTNSNSNSNNNNSNSNNPLPPPLQPIGTIFHISNNNDDSTNNNDDSNDDNNNNNNNNPTEGLEDDDDTTRPRFGYRWSKTLETQIYNASRYSKKATADNYINRLPAQRKDINNKPLELERPFHNLPYINHSTKNNHNCHCQHIPNKYLCHNSSNQHHRHLLTMDPSCLYFLAKPLLPKVNEKLQKVSQPTIDIDTLRTKLTLISKLLTIGLHHRPERLADATNAASTAIHVRDSFITEYRRHSSPNPDKDPPPEYLHAWGQAIFDEMQSNTTTLLKNYNLKDIDFGDFNELVGLSEDWTPPPCPTQTDCTSNPTMRAIFAALFDDFFIIGAKVDKASKNVSFACTEARTRATLNIIIPDSHAIAPYAAAPNSEAILQQLKKDAAQLKNLVARKATLLNQSSPDANNLKPHRNKDDNTNKRIHDISNNINSLTTAITYICSRTFAGYEISDMSPEQTQAHLEDGMASVFPNILNYFPRPSQTDKHGLNSNSFLPAPIALTDKYHKTDSHGNPLIKHRPIVCQVNVSTTPLDKLHGLAQKRLGITHKKRGLQIYETTGINNYKIISSSKQAADCIPPNTNNLNSNDIVNCYGALATDGEFGLINQLSTATKTALQYEHQLKTKAKPTGSYGFILGGTITSRDNQPTTVRPFCNYSFTGQTANFKTCPKRNTDKDTALRPTIFTAAAYNKSLSWSLRNAYCRFGNLVARQANGLPQGVTAGNDFCQHYFHCLEDLEAKTLYDPIIKLQKELEIEQIRTPQNPTKIFDLTDKIRLYQIEGDIHNKDVRYLDDTFSTADLSDDDHTAYLERVYHCAETGLAIEKTGTCRPARFNKSGYNKTIKCTLMDLEILRSADGTTYHRLFDKKRDYKKNFSTTICTFDTATSTCPPGLLLSVYSGDALRRYHACQRFKDFIIELKYLNADFLSKGFQERDLKASFLKQFRKLKVNKFGHHGFNSCLDWCNKLFSRAKPRIQAKVPNKVRPLSRNNKTDPNNIKHRHSDSATSRTSRRNYFQKSLRPHTTPTPTLITDAPLDSELSNDFTESCGQRIANDEANARKRIILAHLPQTTTTTATTTTKRLRRHHKHATTLPTTTTPTNTTPARQPNTSSHNP